MPAFPNSRRARDKSTDRAVFAYTQKHRKPEDQHAFDAQGARELRRHKHDVDLQEQLDELAAYGG